MLINLRNALMSGKRLPYDAEVEYLQSSGTQYINTGVYADLNTVVELFGCSTDSTAISWIFGARNSFASRAFAIYNGSDVQYRYTVSYDSIRGGGLVSNVSSLTGDMVFMRLGANTVIDSWTATYSNATQFTTSSPILIFACWQNGVMYGKCKISSFKIYQNGTLVRDYIPVRKGTVGYLYDRVSGKLFGNAGTGDFVLGPDVVPVEYIESTGTQYINMGVAINTGTDTITSRFMPLTGISTYECLFGASESISGVTTYCELRKLQNTRDWYMLYPNSVGGLGNTLIGTLTDSAWHDVSVSNTGCVMDGVTTSYTVSTRQFTNNQYLFARNNNGSVAFPFKGRVASYSITRSGADIRAMKPIRVGSGSTWEGAMLDTVNRRVYRNVGSGAFAYGNDV